MSHAKESTKFLKDSSYVDWHNETLLQIRKKRDVASLAVSEWEQLREYASAIKENVLDNLDTYLIQFEQQAMANGIQVHWAIDAKEHNECVLNILKTANAKRIIKSKSILTEECGLNHFLEKKGFDVVDSDLGERIVQFAHQPPSHIVLPAIHLKREDIAQIFNDNIGTDATNSDPEYLARAARAHLREKFLQADAAITGVNFAIAETGSVVVCTNEGNADLGVHLANIHIASMGIEKIIPAWQHLGVFTRLLARSATGQAITNYTSHFRKPVSGKEMHIIMVDNGRSDLIQKENFRNSLKCIRCGACMNTCPVYRRSGGYSYQAPVPGPIGSVLFPHYNLDKYKSLPFASSLCGSCTDVCPVKINLHELLFEWRQTITESRKDSIVKRWAMKLMIAIFNRPALYGRMGRMIRLALRTLPKVLFVNRFNTWTKSRELPESPQKSFKEWYINRGKHE